MFLKNSNSSSKIIRSKVTGYAALSKMFKTMNIHFKQPFPLSDNALKKFNQKWSAAFEIYIFENVER